MIIDVFGAEMEYRIGFYGRVSWMNHSHHRLYPHKSHSQSKAPVLLQGLNLSVHLSNIEIE
jgi:hypothetical protein